MSRSANVELEPDEHRRVVVVLDALLHGWSGVALAYGSVQAPLLAGMVRSGVRPARLLRSPLLALPVMAAAAMAFSGLEPLLRGWGAAAYGPAELSVAAVLNVGLGYLAGRVLGPRTPGASRHRRGAVVVDGPDDALEPARSAGPARSLAARRALTLAGVRVAREDETRHFKLIGATGTGKSTAIAELLAGALERGDRAVIADPDGGYLRRFYDSERGDLILNPFEARSARWDLFGEIHAPYDIEQLARALIPEQSEGDRSWREYAQTFFAAVTSQAHAAGVRDVGELFRLLVIADSTELRKLTAGTPAQPFLEEHNARMFDSIRSVTSSAIGALRYVAAQQGASLSVRDWIAGQAGSIRQGGVLFMPYRAGRIAALRSMVSAWMRVAIFATMDQPEGDQRLWFVVDELDALGHIDGLKDALARVRKFGGRCVLGFQSVAQVAATYGAGAAHTVVENCGNSLILRCSSSEGGGTSRFASALIGQREVLRSTFSYSRRPMEWLEAVTRSEQVAIEPAVLGSEIERLPDLTGYLKLASRPDWLRVRIPSQRPTEIPRQAQAPAGRGAQLFRHHSVNRSHER